MLVLVNGVHFGGFHCIMQIDGLANVSDRFVFCRLFPEDYKEWKEIQET